MKLLPAIELETGAAPRAAVIWLHGLGADGNDFAPIVPDLKISKQLPIRFIFPHAPSIPVTINGGFVMPAWYDIIEMDIHRKVDTSGLLASAAEIKKFLDKEIERGISSESIVLAGFSQGGAVAYQTALSYEKSLGGLLTMSTYFATSDTIVYSKANRSIPIKIQHGQHDGVVPEIFGRIATDKLKSEGFTVSYQTYPMEHAVCPEQIDDISLWLENVLLQQTQ